MSEIITIGAEPDPLPVAQASGALSLSNRLPIKIFMDRLRGSYRNHMKFSFLIFLESHHGTDLTRWHIEPTCFADTPDQLRASLLKNKRYHRLHDESAIVAKGMLTLSYMDFTSYRDEGFLPELIVRAFATKQEINYALTNFCNAEVRLCGLPTQWGTIGKILKQFGFSIPV